MLWYVPFFEIMNTNYKTVSYSDYKIIQSNEIRDGQLGKISLKLAENEIHTTRVSLSLALAIILFLGYFASMYLVFWVILNFIAFILNSFMTKYQLQMETLMHRIYQVEDFFKPDASYASP